MTRALFFFISLIFFFTEVNLNQIKAETNQDLLQLQELYDTGAITKKEFDQLKSAISEVSYKKKVAKYQVEKEITTTSTSDFINLKPGKSKKKKIEKKKEPKKKIKDDIVKKLEDLKELYEAGHLTKEEYTKAKKILSE